MVVTNSKYKGTQRERGKFFYFFPRCIWERSAALKIIHVFLLLQAALFLGLGVLFSLVSIPLVIYDWACSSGSDEGHWDQPERRAFWSAAHQVSTHQQPLITSFASSQKQQKSTRYLKWNSTLVAKWRPVSVNSLFPSNIWDLFRNGGLPPTPTPKFHALIL